MTVLWAKQALTGAGWRSDVRVEIGSGGVIECLVADSPPDGARHAILLPAPTNLHSHAFQRAMAGLTEHRGPDPQDSFWTWRALMYKFLDQLTPDDVEAIAALVQMEMLEAGYGAVCEFHYLHHQPSGKPFDAIAEMSERIVAATSETGIGLTLLPVLYRHGGCDRRPLGAGQVRFGCTLEQFQNLKAGAEKALGYLPSDAQIGIAPHSLRAVAPDDLAEVVALAGDCPVHMHLAEQTAEVAEVQAHLRARPAEWLFANTDVGDRWCLIHCTQLEPHEISALAASGAVVGLCPITEANLGDGIFDGVRFVRAGGAFGVGSDSNIRISLSEELRSLEYSQRLRDRGRAMLANTGRSTGRLLFETAAMSGARAAGRPSGVLQEGALADLVALDGDALAVAGKSGDGVLDGYIFAGDDHDARCLVRGPSRRERGVISGTTLLYSVMVRDLPVCARL
ncbi:MAG: formimidoylglutamate deiminase [Hyphomicrobiaceae bacterium]